MDSKDKRVSIRRMVADDAEEICSIYGSIIKEPIGPDFKHLIEEDAERNSTATCLVAHLEGKIVGFMIGYLLPFGFGIERSAWIATVGVHPKYTGQGIGEKMAQELLATYRSQGICVVHTSVQWDSVDLLSFFKSLGFDRSKFINLSKQLK